MNSTFKMLLISCIAVANFHAQDKLEISQITIPTGSEIVIDRIMWAQDIAFGPDGLLYVGTYWLVPPGDFNAWYILDPGQDWAIVDSFGVSGIHPDSVSIPLQGDTLLSPRGVAWNAAGDTMYTADLEGTVVKRWARNVISGRWEFVENFHESDLWIHGVAVAPDGNIWIGFYGLTDTLSNGAAAGPLRVFDKSGSELPFSPISVVTIDGMVDTVDTYCRGLATDNNGNILFSGYRDLYRFDYRSGEGLAKTILQQTSLTKAGVDSNGYIYVGYVQPGPITILNPDFNFHSYVTNNTDVLSRSVQVSPDGKDVYIGAIYTVLNGIRHYHSDTGPGGEYVLVDTIGTQYHYSTRDTAPWGPKLEEVKTILLHNPPNTGDPVLREEAILCLDGMFIEAAAPESLAVENFYISMMEKVNIELQNPVLSGATIWMMYNHGFLIKTPQVTMAFDLVNGVYFWSTELPSELISSIDVLFISHPHGDHFDYSIIDAVDANGGSVIFPSEATGLGDTPLGNTPMAAGDALMLSGMKIKAHLGLHGDDPSLIYEVITPEGLKFLHTGDNYSSTVLPEVDSLDVLLLNAWVNGGGEAAAVNGMRNSLAKLKPALMIPGHLQELGHEPYGRVRYEWAFQVDDIPVASPVQVMAWGDRYQFPDFITEQIVPYKDSLLPRSVILYPAYPNPFNPVTTIRYDLPHANEVTLNIYDLLGREVARLVGGYMEPGYHEVQWNGREFASGIYIARLATPEFSKSIKMLLLK